MLFGASILFLASAENDVAACSLSSPYSLRSKAEMYVASSHALSPRGLRANVAMDTALAVALMLLITDQVREYQQAL
jgi:hypothetical protein